jgi:hypothetical protein
MRPNQMHAPGRYRDIHHAANAVFSKAELVGECWLLPVAPSHRYPRIGFDGKKWQCSHIVYKSFYGPLDGKFVLHKCDNPRCVRPSHLFLGDQKANCEDRGRKDRHAVGERSGMAKLKTEEVLQIKASSGSNRSLAAEFNVHRSHISRIRSGQRWAHAS